jgi:hypothetical protein
VNIKKIWNKGWISFFICSSAFLYLLNFTWLKWGDLIIDVGREAYVPLELMSGKLLYRDIFYLYGPFSPYFNAFLYKLLGPSINTLVLDGIITIILCAILIYKISRLFLDILVSILATMTFLFVFAFGDYYYAGIFNFILPYSYPAIHSILFSLAAFYFFCMWFKKRSIMRAVAVSLFLPLAILCKIEAGLAISTSLIIVFFIYLFTKKRLLKEKDIMLNLFMFIASSLFLASFVYWAFFILSKSMINKNSLFFTLFSSASLNDLFSKNLFAGGSIPKSFLVIGRVSVYYIFLCSYFAAGGIIAENYIYKLKRTVIKNTAYFCILAIFLSMMHIFVKRFFTYELQYRALPLISFIMAVVFLHKFSRAKENMRYLFIVTISSFCFFLMSRMMFNAWAGHYGFYLLAPSLIVYYIFFLGIVPDLFKTAQVRNFYKTCFIFLSIFFIINHFNISRYFYENKTLKISSKRGDIYVFNNSRDYRCKELIEFLENKTDEKETVAIFPEGIFINFLSKRNAPLYYYQYLPVDLKRSSVTEDIIEDMHSKKPDYVVIIQRETYEYGYLGFGYDYGQGIFAYIVNNYALYKQFGPFPFTGRGYGIAVFKRKI